MSEPTSLPNFEAKIDKDLELSLDLLTEDEQSRLSKVLFPETHVKEVMLCEKVRSLHPLTVKYSRKLHALAEPLVLEVEKAQKDGTVFQIDEQLSACLFKIILVMCEAYGREWDDVKGRATDEDIHLDELQGAIVAQQNLQGLSDFLLSPLHVLVKIMRAREVAEVLDSRIFARTSTGPLPASDSGVISIP